MERHMTSEYVGIGHPDKVADQISDTVLDLYLHQDPNSRVAVETMVSGNKVILAGEVTSKTEVTHEDIDIAVRETLRNIGYTSDVPGNFNDKDVEVTIYIKPQSPNIHDGVDKTDGEIGAGDQGIMFGYAIDETPEFLPLSYVAASELLTHLNSEILEGNLPTLFTDNKSQVCVRYDDESSLPKIEKIILSSWHSPDLSVKEVQDLLSKEIVEPFIQKYRDMDLVVEEPEIFINSAGPFFIGGPEADAGLTGRKIIVDTYGGYAPHGGGAFSGKDPSKVDRSAAYMARHIAKSLVANRYASEALVQLSYAIGHTQPFSISVNSDSDMEEEDLVALIRDNFDLSPAGIISYLKLNDSEFIEYKDVASGGHFLDQSTTWEQVSEF